MTKLTSSRGGGAGDVYHALYYSFNAAFNYTAWCSAHRIICMTGQKISLLSYCNSHRDVGLLTISVAKSFQKLPTPTHLSIHFNTEICS